jgi:pyridoxal 5'-phosphate synthase pdxS subunit
MDAISIPIMAKCRLGHVSEADILSIVGVDMIDESEVLTPADELRHIWKWNYTTPFVNGAKKSWRSIEKNRGRMRHDKDKR